MSVHKLPVHPDGANLYIRDGVDIVVSGSGIINFRSANEVIENDYENIIGGNTGHSDELYDFTGTERRGESSKNQTLTVYGGLTKEELASVKAMKESLPEWQRFGKLGGHTLIALP